MKLLAMMKKEFLRFFRDPRLILTMLLPGIVIYALYSVMGSVIRDASADPYAFQVYVQGSSVTTEQMSAAAALTGSEVAFTQTDDAEGAKKAVADGDITAFLVFSENFDETVLAFEGGEPQAYAELYYRSADEESAAFCSVASQVLGVYQRQFTVSEHDCSDEHTVLASLLGGLLPFLVIAMVFAAGMSVTLESMAGEKERGTLATILVTPVRRSVIALGKVIPLSCISLIGAFSSFLGIILSLPKLMGLSVGGFMSGYGFLSYFMLFLLIISIVPLIVAAITAVSAYAKSVKEASAYTGIIMIFVMVLSLASAFVANIGSWAVVLPLFNAVTGMQKILFGTYAVWEPLVSVLMNIVYTALLVLLIAKMLSGEKIMFGK